MRIISLFLILLLAFQCAPHSVRVKVVSVCINADDVNPDDVSVPNPGTLLEDEIPHFTFSVQKYDWGTAVQYHYSEAGNWPPTGCRIPENQAHDVDTPPPNQGMAYTACA